MWGDKCEPPWYAGGRGGEEGGGGDGGSTLMFCGSWSVLNDEGGMEREVEAVGVGDETRDGGNDEDLERGDEGVEETVRGKLTVELLCA
jgi:hypothetical protein